MNMQQKGNKRINMKETHFKNKEHNKPPKMGKAK